MRRILSDVLFNRALIWLVIASLENDNEWLKGAYLVLALLSFVKSARIAVEEDA